MGDKGALLDKVPSLSWGLPFGELMNSGEKKAYAAALVDGEGTIRVTRLLSGHRPTYYPDTEVANTNRSLLLFLQRNYGGAIGPIPLKKGHKRVYRWRVRRAEAKYFLHQIEPYLIAKRAQAKLALACPLGKSGRDTTPSEYQRMEDIHRKITILNRRGRKAEQLQMELKTQEQLSLPI